MGTVLERFVSSSRFFDCLRQPTLTVTTRRAPVATHDAVSGNRMVLQSSMKKNVETSNYKQIIALNFEANL